jgi:hypothetical protein
VILRTIGALTVLVLLAGCAGAARHASSAPAPPHGRELVYMSRNVEQAIPEDIVVFADGTVHYRLLLHTKRTMRVRSMRLGPAALGDLHRLLAGTRLDGAQVLGVEPRPRGAFRYLLRIDGRSITTVDGRLTPGVKPLIRRLDRLEDLLLLRGEDPA